MNTRLNESASIIALVLVIGAVVLNFDFSLFRRKTYWEKNHLKCLTGITTEDRNLFNEKFGIRNIYLNWNDIIPIQKASKVSDVGSILMVTWEPYFRNEEKDFVLPDIVKGEYDEYIKKFAQIANDFNKPIFLRWAQEPNGDWYSWSGSNTESSIYIEAYRRIHKIFKSVGCRNVKFVFSVNYSDIPNKRWNRFENYYPGSDYIDVLGIDVYNWGDMHWWSKWTHPKKIIKKVYERMIRLDKTKPIMISEVASCKSGGDKSRWVSDFLDVVENKFTAVKAFVWFDWKKECNWKITEEKKVFSVYKKSIKGNFFSDKPKDFYNIFGFAKEGG